MAGTVWQTVLVYAMHANTIILFFCFFFVFVSFLEMHTFFFSNLLPPSEWLCDICQCLCFTLVEHFCHIINICKKINKN